jgi:hypothetical protein
MHAWHASAHDIYTGCVYLWSFGMAYNKRGSRRSLKEDTAVMARCTNKSGRGKFAWVSIRTMRFVIAVYIGGICFRRPSPPRPARLRHAGGTRFARLVHAPTSIRVQVLVRHHVQFLFLSSTRSPRGFANQTSLSLCITSACESRFSAEQKSL